MFFLYPTENVRLTSETKAGFDSHSRNSTRSGTSWRHVSSGCLNHDGSHSNTILAQFHFLFCCRQWPLCLCVSTYIYLYILPPPLSISIYITRLESTVLTHFPATGTSRNRISLLSDCTVTVGCENWNGKYSFLSSCFLLSCKAKCDLIYIFLIFFSLSLFFFFISERDKEEKNN